MMAHTALKHLVNSSYRPPPRIARKDREVSRQLLQRGIAWKNEDERGVEMNYVVWSSCRGGV